MIKLIVIARCIPEDVYLRSIELPAQTQTHAGEKKFPIVVRDPETWYIGRLAIEIKNRYESLYKRPFGQIKYLKDNEDDCDLDPELSVADLLVDEGKAARDGADQRKIVKVIQEQGRSIRLGSVIPDLTPVHYQPPTKPPVPKFPAPQKRDTEDDHVEERPSKRRRLGQIEEEEEGNDIVRSIEGNALTNGNLDDLVVQPKRESSEIAMTWLNTGPATRDELELLPQAPPSFEQRAQRPRSRRSVAEQYNGPEIRETSPIIQEQEQERNHPITVTSNDRAPIADRFARQYSSANADTPITPPFSGNGNRTPAAQAVSILNGMKSASPAQRQSTSGPANGLRQARKDIYDYEESDIDDTQMSPRSKASRMRITPKLVRTPHSRIGGSSAIKNDRSTSSRQDNDAVEMDNNKENQTSASKEPHLPQSRFAKGPNATVKAQNHATTSWQNGGFVNIPVQSEVAAKRPHPESGSWQADQSSDLGTDETWSVQEDGTTRKKKKQRMSKAQRTLITSHLTSRSSSMVSSTRESAKSEKAAGKSKKSRRVAPTKIADIGDQDNGEEDLDSPSAQLEQSLRQSSPIKEKSRNEEASASARPSSSKSASASASVSIRSISNRKQSRGINDETIAAEGDIRRLPESASDSGEDEPPLKIPHGSSSASKQNRPLPEASAGTDLRCYTCWSKSSTCERGRPKCTNCVKNKKNCQIYDMTKAEAAKEKADRKSGAARASKATREPSTKPSAKPAKKAAARTNLSEQNISATDSDEGSSEEGFSTAVVSTTPRARANMSKPSDKLKTDTKSKPVKHQLAASVSDTGADPAEGSGEDAAETVQSHKAGTQDVHTQAASKPQKKKPKGRLFEEHLLILKHEEKANHTDTLGDADVIVQAAAVDTLPTSSPLAAQVIPAAASTMARGERSSESHATSTILPPGMTKEQYEAQVKARSHITEAGRQEQNLLARKLEKRKEKDLSPLVPRSQSSQQDSTELSRKQTPSVQSDTRVPSSSKDSVNITEPNNLPPPSTQPANIGSSIKASTPAPGSQQQPKSAPPKSQVRTTTPAPASKAQTTTVRSKLTLHPTTATTASTPSSTKHQNPPFRPQQPQSQPRKSLLGSSLTANLTTNTNAAAPAVSLTTSRSLADVRKALKSQSNAGSSVGTPQPLTAAARVAALKARGTAAVQKKGFSLSEDEEEEEESSDSDSDSDSEDKGVTDKNKDGPVVVVPPKMSNAAGVGRVVLRKRTPTATESGSESGSGSGSEDDGEEDE